MRILHVTPYWADAWAYGGIPRVVGAFATGLARRGHAVTVCATDAKSRDERLAIDARAHGVDLRVFRNRSNRLAYDWQCFTPVGLNRYLRDHAHEFDVAHIHACRNFPGAIAAHYLDRYGVPYVLAPNGTAPLIERRRGLKRAFDLLFGRRMLRHAAAILAVSEAERQQLAALGVALDKIHLVPNPIELDEFAQRDRSEGAMRLRAKWGLQDAPLVMFLGKITPRKRLDTLIQAFALVDSRAQLVVAGNDMGGLAEMKALASQLGVSHRLKCVGLLSGGDRLDALAAADVVVYPSEDEVFGLVAFEALLSGTPVIVAGDSGCGEIVRAVGGGVLVPVGDSRALGDAMTTMLGDTRNWRAAASQAAVHVRERFGAPAVTAQLDGVYRQIGGLTTFAEATVVRRSVTRRRKAADYEVERGGVSYVVPVKNGAATLARTLASIDAERALIARDSEVIVIDDRSDDASLAWLKSQEVEGRLRLFDGAGRGLSAAINLGVQVARHPIVCQVDQDVELLPGWTERLVGVLERDSRIGAVQGHYTRDPRAGWIPRAMAIDLEQRYAALLDGSTTHVCTGNTAFRVSALREAGLLDESLGYGGDVDISYRLTGAGWKLAHCQRAKSFHQWREGLAGYCRQQFGFGFGRLDVVRKHPDRVTGDSVAPALMMAQPLLTAASLVSLALAGTLAIAGGPWIPATALGFFFLVVLSMERAVAGFRALWRFGDPAALTFPLLHLARNLSWIASIVVWTGRRLARQSSQPSHSMQPRPVATFIPSPIRTVGIIPVHNEAASIAAVVAEVRSSCPAIDLLVVDDGSTDSSGDLLERLGVRYLQLPERMGIGSAMRAGLRYARRLGYDSAIRLDGDGQHSAADIERLLAPLREGRADVSLGSRFLSLPGLTTSAKATVVRRSFTRRRKPRPTSDVGRPGETNVGRPFRAGAPVRLTQRILGACLSTLTRHDVTDPTSGFYAVGPRAMRLLAEHHPTGYPEPELRLFLSRNGLAVVEVPIEERPRLGGRTTLTPGRLAAAGARVLLAMLIVPLRPIDRLGRADRD